MELLHVFFVFPSQTRFIVLGFLLPLSKLMLNKPFCSNTCKDEIVFPSQTKFIVLEIFLPLSKLMLNKPFCFNTVMIFSIFVSYLNGNILLLLLFLFLDDKSWKKIHQHFVF